MEKKSKIDSKAFVADSADLLGDVTMAEGSSLWFGAVARGDMDSIKIGKFTNVQDNVSLHVDNDMPLSIGDYTTIGHNAVVHGCTIGNNSLIGMGSVILNKAIIGDNCIIGAGAVITEGTVIPDNSLVVGAPGKVIREVSEEEIEYVRYNAVRYEKLWRDNYKKI